MATLVSLVKTSCRLRFCKNWNQKDCSKKNLMLHKRHYSYSSNIYFFIHVLLLLTVWKHTTMEYIELMHIDHSV